MPENDLEKQPKKYFEITKKVDGTRARTGVIHTAHGDVITPQLAQRGLSKLLLAKKLNFGVRQWFWLIRIIYGSGQVMR